MYVRKGLLLRSLEGVLLIVSLDAFLQEVPLASPAFESQSASAVALLDQESLPSCYGLATYPYWEAGAL